MPITIHEAKSQLSKLAERVRKGEKVVITQAGKPCMDLVPHQEEWPKRRPGRLKGQIEMAADFDETPLGVTQDCEGD